MSFSGEDEFIVDANILPNIFGHRTMLPLPEDIWHWLVSGLHLFFMASFIAVLPTCKRATSWAALNSLQSLASSLSGLIGFAYLGIFLSLYSKMKLPAHETVAFAVQGFAWMILALTVKLRPRQLLLIILLRGWWIVTFLIGTLVAVYSGHEFLLKQPVSLEGIVGLISWPVCLLLLVLSGRLSSTYDSDDETCLSEPLLTTASSSSSSSSSEPSITPFVSAGFMSRILFTWLNPLLSLGRRTPLEAGHIPKLGKEDKAEAAYNIFRKNWEDAEVRNPQKEPSLFWVMASCYATPLAWNALHAFMKCVTLSAGPLVLKIFIDFAQGRVLFKYEGYVLVGTLLVAKLVESISQRQWYFGSRRIGMHLRSALIAAIYQKELKLSSLGRQSHAAGEVVSYMAVDAYRIGELPYWFHLIWATPLQIIFALCILFAYVGLPTLAGMTVIVLTMVINAPMANRQQEYQNNLMGAQDERLRATSEVLRHMKTVKLQAWEERFRSLVDELRNEEVKWLSAVQYRKTYNSLVFWLSPILVSTVTFATCYYMGSPLTASNIFTALATFRIIQEPIRVVPDLVAVLVQVKVSMARITKFLQDDELDTTAVIRNFRASSDYSIQMNGTTVSWDPTDYPALRNINLIVKHGGKVAVCGEVGSGKSTLICSILGEAPKLSGSVRINGSVAYVAQIAWIQCGTIRENILFGRPMDEGRYRRTLRACALDKDLENLPFRDLTEIGERGLNISGGQKQRIQLARAVYQDADIYLLDDPFSAVDAHTCASLFKNCIMGILAKKTIVLVTHQVEYLPVFDNILLMRDGEVCQSGKYKELLEEGSAFEGLVSAHNEVMGVLGSKSVGSVGNASTGSSAAILLRKLSSAKSLKDSYVLDETKVGHLTKQEEKETGDTGLTPYLNYLREANGYLYCTLAGLSHIVFVAGQLASNWWLAAEVGNPSVSTARLIGVYAAIGLSTVSFLFLRSVFIVIMGLSASSSFFSELMTSLFRAPMAFFDTTPSGRILSRISVDLSIVDIDVPFSLGYGISASVNSLSNLGITAAVTWQILVIIIPMLYANRLLQVYYLQSARELMRINGVTKSPIMNFFGEAITGAGTIRAFIREGQFLKKILTLIDDNCNSSFYSFAANEWLVLRLEALCTAVVCSSALVMVLLPPGKINPGFVGLAISYGLSLNVSLVFSIQHQCTLANYIISVERIKQYLDIPREAPAVLQTSRPPSSWPSKGKVELRNLQIAYRPDTPLVLRGITCTFEGGQKVGVVGRSGSGKTTLISALFRLTEPVGGKILIDELDITSIGLGDLRSKLCIIPQEPTLFRGTVRFNLDPEGLYSDVQIWEALDKCQLGTSVREKPEHLDSPVGDDGENWSVGQRQLFCLGRVLLKNSRILVLDEATASIDNATDAVLQKLLREEFSECTVVTVAHRIPTVVDSDMVLALSDGILAEFDEPMKLLEKKTSLFAKLVAEYWSNSQPSNLETTIPCRIVSSSN